MILHSIIILVLGLFSAFLFYRLNFGQNLKKFTAYNRIAFQTIKAQDIPDEVKQKTLMDNALKLFLNSLEIMLKTLVVLSPYLLIWVVALLRHKPEMMDIFVTTQAIILSLVAFAAFYLAKAIYAKI